MAQRAIRPVLEARTPAFESPPADWGFRYRDLIAAVILIPAAAAALVSTSPVPSDSGLALGFDVIAWLLFLAGAALRFWATLYVGGRKRDMIVADGPYSLCRHPLYLASFLMSVSAGLFMKSPGVVGAALVAAGAYLLTTVPQEEAALARLHPRSWAEYAARVPRVVPSRRGWRTPARITVDIGSLRDEAARASRWVLLPLLAQVASHLREQPWWPHVLHTIW